MNAPKRFNKEFAFNCSGGCSGCGYSAACSGLDVGYFSDGVAANPNENNLDTDLGLEGFGLKLGDLLSPAIPAAIAFGATSLAELTGSQAAEKAAAAYVSGVQAEAARKAEAERLAAQQEAAAKALQAQVDMYKQIAAIKANPTGQPTSAATIANQDQLIAQAYALAGQQPPTTFTNITPPTVAGSQMIPGVDNMVLFAGIGAIALMLMMRK